MKTSGLTSLSLWYGKRPVRERVILFVCLLVVLVFLWDLVVLQPLDKQKKQLAAKTSQLHTSLVELEAREQVVEGGRNVDPDRENRQRLESLQEELAKLRSQLAENVASLISPQEMPDLLKALLQRQKKLLLLRLENLPPEEMNIGTGLAKQDLPTGLYRHRLLLEFSGNYLDTLSYLRDLEKLPGDLVWQELEIKTLDYPLAKVRLEVFTLSLNPGWIGG